CPPWSRHRAWPLPRPRWTTPSACTRAACTARPPTAGRRSPCTTPRTPSPPCAPRTTCAGRYGSWPACTCAATTGTPARCRAPCTRAVARPPPCSATWARAAPCTRRTRCPRRRGRPDPADTRPPRARSRVPAPGPPSSHARRGPSTAGRPPAGSPAPQAVTRHPAGPAPPPAPHGTAPPPPPDDPRAAPQPPAPSHAPRPPPARPGPRSSHPRHEAAHPGARRPRTGTPALGLSGGTPPARPALQPRTAPGRPRHGTAPGRLPGPGGRRRRCPRRALSEGRHLVPVGAHRARVAVRLQAALEVAHVLHGAHRAHLRRLARRLHRELARLVEFAEAQAGGGQDDAAEQPAAGVGRGAQVQGAFCVLRGGPELLEVAVAVAELVGELRLVEAPRPVRHLVAGTGARQGAFRAHQRGGAGPHLAEHPVAAGLGRVQHRLDDRRDGTARALLGDPGQLHRLAP